MLAVTVIYYASGEPQKIKELVFQCTREEYRCRSFDRSSRYLCHYVTLQRGFDGKRANNDLKKQALGMI